MKIGIVTFWQTRDNYGQMLQCFALQQSLKMLGHTPYLIRYLHSEHKNPWQDQLAHFLHMFFLLRWNHLFLRRKRLPDLSDKEKLRDFESFKETFLEKSEYIYSSLSELKNNPPKADCYIVGSDQVWSKSLSVIENQVFFLNFGSKKIRRISYAASFSMIRYPKKNLQVLKKMLNNFEAVSVREMTGVEICKKIDVSSKLVADPSILITGDDYRQVFKLNNDKKQQIFIYSVNISTPEEIRWDNVKEMAKNKRLNITVTPSSGYIPGNEIFGKYVTYEYCKIPEWLDNIANSEFVITTSFHGIVFCLLFHTPFIYVPLKGKYSRGNNRVIDLLAYLGIDGHILNDGINFETLASTSFDWKEIDYKINKFRDISMLFLTGALEYEK